MVIVSAIEAEKWGKPVQGDRQTLQIQGAAWGRKGQMSKLIREIFNSSGCSALSGSVFKNDCSPSLMPSSGESDEADAKVLSEGMPLG